MAGNWAWIFVIMGINGNVFYHNKSIAKEIKTKNGLAGDICLFSLKMSDTERLREEYNQLVEGKVQ